MREFTSFDAAAVARELNSSLGNSITNNIYQPNENIILLKLHKTGMPPSSLVVEAGKRLNLTTYNMEKPPRPSGFCMALRKHLRNARLLKVEQHEFERVILFSFRTREGMLKLILELFGEGNIILLDEKETILQALIYKEMKDRKIARGEPFKFAPSFGKNPFKLEDEEILTGLGEFGNFEVVRAIPRLLSIGGTFTEELLTRANLEKTKHVSQLSNEELTTTIKVLRDLLYMISEGNLEPNLVFDEKEDIVDALPLKLKRYETSTFRIEMCNSFNEALDEYYSKRNAIEEAARNIRTSDLELEETRIKRIVAEQRNTLDYANAEGLQLKRFGDLIYANFNDLQMLHDAFRDAKNHGKSSREIAARILSSKQKGLKPFCFFETFNEQNATITVSVEGSSFELSLRKTLFENAALFYGQSKRAKQKADGAKTALNEYLEKLQVIESKIAEAKKQETLWPIRIVEKLEKQRVKRREWFEKFRWFESSEGLLVVAGRDAVTNEVLIKKHTESTDIVFHADIIGAPFTVIKMTVGKTVGQKSLSEAAEFAAAFSRAWREGFASMDVYWVRPEQLSKGGQSGESVGHGAFVVRGARNWLRGTPLKLALGVILESDGKTARIIGGPLEAVKNRTDAYVTIMPGDLKGKDLFRLIAKKLAEKVPEDTRDSVLNISHEAIREFVPFGKAILIKR